MRIKPSVNRPALLAFSLVEVLAVTALMALLMAVMVPSISSVKNGQNISKVSADIAGTLEQARAYAMANNTYVFVGLAEVDGVQPESARPQQNGTGRLLMAVASSKDGTRGYETANPASSWAGASNLSAITRLQRFDGVHLADVLSSSVAGMEAVDAASRLGSVTVSTSFDWPLGSSQKVCTFSRVIQFDPQGSATIPSGSGLSRWLEVALQPAHGNQVAAGPNFAALQLDGITGAVRLFRP